MTSTTPDLHALLASTQRLQTVLIGLLIIVLIGGGWAWSSIQSEATATMKLEMTQVRIELQVMNERLSTLRTEVARQQAKGD